jgi:hypothetical protein
MLVYGITVITGLGIVAFAATGTLDPLLRAWGLPTFSHSLRGVYADCSKPENRRLTFCLSKEERAGKRVPRYIEREAMPFSLSE